MTKDQTVKYVQYKVLTPLYLEWTKQDETKESSLVFLDLSSNKAYNGDGREVIGQAVDQVFDKIKGSQKPNPSSIASDLYRTVMSLQEKIYEESEELIDGTKRSEGGRIRAWSGGPTSGDPKELGQPEDGEVYSEAGPES